MYSKLNILESHLIGDLSKPYALPFLLEGTRHRDLKTISSDTLARLMQGEFAKELGPGGGYQIIDCRYPFEFDAGHIRGAWNIYSFDQIRKTFPSIIEENQEKAAQRLIYIFYCEFSAMRGSRIMRYLRNHDRSHHYRNYPKLNYPELYLLHKGYNSFHGTHVDLCEPNGYVSMLSPEHRETYRTARLLAWLNE
ncbi:cdc25-like protein phosphatase twine [Drosophila serrata]|uniref:cdc25-like protein phosphatase twine n=1 Tax=Drosophila serrata TaxID=7274 RepID=UPI000A1D185B|nr:cdc25-like protein phosphatase twine [Drosophila serrata]XP_020802822.1 cdc25-like protein phosphatase twine [Drosophila serrata]